MEKFGFILHLLINLYYNLFVSKEFCKKKMHRALKYISGMDFYNVKKKHFM